MKIAVCYLTCTQNNLYFNLDRLKQHAETSKNDVSVFVYNNDESVSYEKIDNTVKFSWKYLQDKFNYHHIWSNESSNVAGIQFLSLIDLYDTYKNEFDFYVFFEDDLMINTFKNIFDCISFKYEIGLISPRKHDEYWYWINQPNNISHIYEPYSGLLTYYFFRTDILKYFIKKTISLGLYAHHEYLINGFICKASYDIFYYNKYYKCCNKLYSNELEKYKNDKTYEIIHPVKNKNIYDNFLNNNII